MSATAGCSKEKHKLIFNGNGFESKKTEYAAGDKVTVYYNFIGTDTDYIFSIDEDVKMERDYDNVHGYIFRFTMPDHDVTISVESHNSMMDDPDAHRDDDPGIIDETKMIFDYYDAVVGTDGGDGYDEFVLYERDGESLFLAKYSKWGDAEGSMSYCTVPLSVLDNCMAVVDEYHMADWKDGTAMAGVLLVVKIKDGDSLKRISSEAMPEGGEKAFNQISSVLSSAWGEYAEGDDIWVCPECGNRNKGKFCSECGRQKPE